MLKVLIKKQVQELFASYFVDKKTGKARNIKKTVSFFCMFFLLLVVLGFSFYKMFLGMGNQILNIGINWFYFSITGLISIALGVFASVFNTYASLYLPKDNDLLLSLPIKPQTIVISRLINVYLMSLLYSAWVWIPSVIAYYMIVPLNVLNVIFPILLIFVISLFVMILSCILGYLIAVISTKTKGNNFLKVFFSLFIMVAYYVIYFKVVNQLESIQEHINGISSWIKSWMQYTYLLGNAADGKAIPMIIISILTLLGTITIVYIICKSFLKLSTYKDTVSSKGKKNIKYRERDVNKTLLLREYQHFSSVPTWMLNGGLGLLIMPCIAIFMLIKKNYILSMIESMEIEVPFIGDSLALIIFIAICFIISMNNILACSISMEGKTFWQIKSLPIDLKQIIINKEKMYLQLNVIAALPLLIISGIILKLNIIHMLLIAIGIYLFIFLVGDFGLYLDLKNPNFNWSNVVSVIKQSMPAMISIFGGWFFILVISSGAIYLAQRINLIYVLIIMIFIFFVLWQLIHRWIMKKGIQVLQEL